MIFARIGPDLTESSRMTRPQLIDTDVMVLGGGAAGLMCARQAGRRGRRVIILDRAPRVGAKILLSGGGRCNFSNRQCGAENYISPNVHFCKSALSQFGTDDFLDLLEQHKLPYEQREGGRLFCRRPAVELVQMLEKECLRHGVKFHLDVRVDSIRKNDRFTISTHQGIFRASSLVVATGGLSYPQAGASDLGHQVARQFGLIVTPCRPGLAPLLYSEAERAELGVLSGISVMAAVGCPGRHFADSVLFTQQGLSGPAILQISSYWRQADMITIDWLPAINVYEVLTDRKRLKGADTVPRTLAPYLPNRMVQKWTQRYFPEKSLAECSPEQLRRAAENLNRWPFRPCATEGYGKAEVTVGGVSTDELSSQTMMAHKVPGLYFIGEVVDVTGQLGGYNLQWAWSSGFAAGAAV